MIKVDLREENKIVITGHSGYDELGKDIVCASVSSIVVTTINAIIDFDETAIEYTDKNDKTSIEIVKNDNITNKLINNMIFMLSTIEKDYPKNIKILRR